MFRDFILIYCILVQVWLKPFPKVPKTDMIFSFSIRKWHIIVQTNRSNMLFFKNNKRHLALSFNIVEDANKIDSVYFYSSYFFLFLSTVLIFLLLLFLFNIQKKNN